jgi:hypothetical protein
MTFISFPARLLNGISSALIALGVVSCASNGGMKFTPTPDASSQHVTHHIHNVFIIMMENHNWTGNASLSIKGNPEAHYINEVLIPDGAHPSNYNNPPHIHPSLPNYLWLEAGTNFGILNDNHANGANTQTTGLHLVTLLKNAGISWRSYDAWSTGKTCLLDQDHTPFVFFDDVTNHHQLHSKYCIDHVRPISELDSDLVDGKTARYSFIVPNLCQAMHSYCGKNQIKAGDEWLSGVVPKILDSSAYKDGGVLFIVWDEAARGDGPIPMLILSPYAKKGGFTNHVYYNHSSTLRTVEEIFGVSPLLRDAAHEPDLKAFFTVFP